MDALIVGGPSLRKICQEKGFTQAARFDQPKNDKWLRPICLWLGKVDVLITDSFRWVMTVPMTIRNARNPGKLIRVFVNDIEFPIDLFDQIIAEAMDNEIFETKRARLSRNRARKSKRGPMTPVQVMRKYPGLTNYLKDDDSETNVQVSELFGVSARVVRRVRKAMKDVRKSPLLEFPPE